MASVILLLCVGVTLRENDDASSYFGRFCLVFPPYKSCGIRTIPDKVTADVAIVDLVTKQQQNLCANHLGYPMFL